MEHTIKENNEEDVAKNQQTAAYNSMRSGHYIYIYIYKDTKGISVRSMDRRSGRNGQANSIVDRAGAIHDTGLGWVITVTLM